MKTKPLIFNLYALVFGVIFACMPAQIMMLYGHNINEMGAIFNKLTFFNYLVMFISGVNILTCLYASDHIKWSFPLSIGIVCINNSFVLLYGNDFESYAVILSTILYVSMISYFFLATETEIMNHPENHWWRIPQRVMVRDYISITHPENQMTEEKELFDLSSGGAFINLQNYEDLNSFRNGEIITIKIGKNHPISAKAKVVRKASAKGHYPNGIGIQFLEMGLIDKVRLLHKISHDQSTLAA